MNKFDMISDLLAKTSKAVVKDEKSWLSFLDTASYMFKYSFANQILIYAQKSNARACASFDYWNERMNRWIRKGAKGIALIDDTKRYSSLRYVFDISDTRSPHNQELKLWSINESMYDDVIESLSYIYDGLENEHDLGNAYLLIAHMLVEDNSSDYLQQMMKYHQNSSFEGMEEFEIKKIFESTLENSLAYCMMKRCDIETSFYFEEGDFDSISLFDTFDVIGILGTANKEISDMALTEIGKIARELMKAQNRTFVQRKNIFHNEDEEKERSVTHERDHVQSGRGLSVSKPQDTKRKETVRKIRHDENELSQNQPASTSVRIESEQYIEQSLERSAETGRGESRNDDGTDATKTSSSRQREEFNGVGETHEYLESTGGGSRFTGDRLQLDLNLGDIEVTGEPKIPPFDLQDLPQLLREDIKLQHSREEIAVFFKTHSDDKERAKYLEECYDDTLVQTFRKPEDFDYSYLGYRKNGHGLDIWSGNYLKKESQSFLSFFELQKEVSKLIDKGEYLIPRWSKMSGLQQAYRMKILNRNAMIHLLSYHDELLQTSSQIIAFFKEHEDEQDRLQYIKDCYPKHVVEWETDGVPLGLIKEDEHLHMYFGTFDRQEESVDYEWEHAVKEIDGLILSRYYDPKVQIPTLEEQKNAVYENEDSLKNGIYFSQEEIDCILTHGSNVQNGKYRIYQQMSKHEGEKQNIAFLKNEYGIGGSSPAVGVINEWHDTKGITLSRGREIGNDEIKITLKWSQVNRRINELIELDRYLNKAENEHYPIFLQKQMKKELAFERSQHEEVKEDNKIGEKPKTYHQEYIYHEGDIFYYGADEYVIQNISDYEIYASNVSFPLFADTFTKEQFEQILKENPLNDRLLHDVIDVEPVTQEDNETNQNTKDDTLNDDGNLLKQYYPLIKEKIENSPIYSALRDRDTTADEAEELITSESFPIISSMNDEHRELYLAYMENDDFRSAVINGLIEDIYEDYSQGVDYSSFIKDSDTKYQQFYKMFNQFAKNIVEQKSCYMLYRGTNYDEPLTITNFTDEPEMIEMFHINENYIIDVYDPYMKFVINREDKTLKPVYYEKDNLIYDISQNDNELIQEELDQYTGTWLQNIIDKKLHLTMEQYYSDENRLGHYIIDIYDDGIDGHDMPYSMFEKYCRDYGFEISPDYRQNLELNTLENILHQLKIEDIEISWDDEYDCIIAGDGYNKF